MKPNRIFKYLGWLAFAFGLCCGGSAVFTRAMHVFMAHSKQVECRSNLKALCSAEGYFFTESGRYSDRVREVGFLPEERNRYAYFLSTAGAIEPRPVADGGLPNATAVAADDKFGLENSVVRASLPLKFQGGIFLGVNGECPRCSFTAACAGNPDSDAALDVWSVSTAPRTADDGSTIPACEPFNEADDVDFLHYTHFQ